MGSPQKKMALGLLLLVVVYLWSDLGFAVKTLPNFKNLHQFVHIGINLPEGFKTVRLNKEESYRFLAAPFADKEVLVESHLYANEIYPFCSIVTLISESKFEPAQWVFDKNALISKGIRIVGQEPKVFRAEGLIFVVKHFAQGTEFRKLVAVFGNSIQTSIVVAIYPEDRAEQMRDMMRRVVELAWMTDDPLGGS